MHISCDLHTHSTVSDGTLSPADVMTRAHDKGVAVIALTDHDATEGLHEAAAAARQYGMQFVPGIELSVTWSHQTIHIVGLGIDADNTVLNTGLQRLRRFRQQRGEAIAAKLEKAGFDNPLAGAQRYAGGDILSRTHFARYILEQGKAKDMRQVFKRYLVRGKPGHVPGQWASLEEALCWIHAAGGLAVIAHPARYRLSATRLRQLIEAFKDLGGIGFEAISGSHGADEEQRMLQLAKQYGLYVSLGSDFHSPDAAYREIGALPLIPAGYSPVWESERWQQSVGVVS